MPELFHRPIHRKEFLRVSAGILGSFVVSLGGKTSLGDEGTDPGHACPLRLAILSDTHVAADPAEVYRGFKPYENLQQVVRQVLIAQPDAAVINGDAARLNGQLADYQQLQQLLEPVAKRAPIGIGLGNHDDRRNFRKTLANPSEHFQRQDEVGKHVLVMEHPFVRIILLDSLLYVNQVAGLLGKSQRMWLARFLTSADNRPTVLFVHHTLGDGDGELLDGERMFRIIEPHRNVKAVFYGHSHRYHYDRRGHLHLINLPACGYNFGDDQPVGWLDGRFLAHGCELTLRAIGGNIAQDGETVPLAWEA